MNGKGWPGGESADTAARAEGRAWLLMLAGPTRSGKSTLAAEISRRSDAARVSFGDAVRARTDALGLSPTRLSWQRVGAQWVSEDPRGLCEQVLSSAAEHARIVVDGVRHVVVARQLMRHSAGRRPLLVYVTVAQPVQQRRLHAEGLTAEEIARVVSDVTESELPAVARIADVTVDGESSTEDNAERVLAVLAQICGG